MRNSLWLCQLLQLVPPHRRTKALPPLDSNGCPAIGLHMLDGLMAGTLLLLID
jgi:hypothetical protein